MGRQGDRETGRQGDAEIGGRGDAEMGRHRDAEMGRRGDAEMGRRGDAEMRRRGDAEMGDGETETSNLRFAGGSAVVVSGKSPTYRPSALFAIRHRAKPRHPRNLVPSLSDYRLLLSYRRFATSWLIEWR